MEQKRPVSEEATGQERPILIDLSGRCFPTRPTRKS